MSKAAEQKDEREREAYQADLMRKVRIGAAALKHLEMLSKMPTDKKFALIDAAALIESVLVIEEVKQSPKAKPWPFPMGGQK